MFKIKFVDFNDIYIRMIFGSHGGDYEDGFFWVVAPCSLALQPRRQPSSDLYSS
jgi:hypothetical protein